MLNRASKKRNRASRSPGNHERRHWPTLSIVVAGAAVFFALGGSAIAAGGLIRAGDIARDAVTSRAIKGGAIWPSDLNAKTQESLQGADGATGAKGNTGLTGTAGTNGANGANGANGPNGANGANGANGVDGSDGTNGSAGTNGTAGTAGIDGIDGTNGIDGTDGIDGTIAPLWTTNGLTALPTATPPTVVVTMPVPAAGTYVVLAKTQLSHTGAGDSIDCQLKAGSTTIDQVSMKTLPALAAIPASLQAVTTTTSPSQLSVECDVLTANGSANFSSLIAIPTG
jgi:Collagen triple helix repeat (20 copies)